MSAIVIVDDDPHLWESPSKIRRALSQGGYIARVQRERPPACHREEDRGAAPRHGQGEEPAGSRGDVYRGVAGVSERIGLQRALS